MITYFPASSRYGQDGIDAARPVVALVESVANEYWDAHQPADESCVIDLSSVPVLDPETLTQRFSRHNGQPGCSLLESVGQHRRKHQSPDQAQIILCSGSGTRHHCTWTHRARGQHGPVQHRPDLFHKRRNFHTDSFFFTVLQKWSIDTFKNNL